MKRPVIFGEVLFDSFPDGRSVLGGAPFNVAWHLQGLGLNPLFISRIGDDKNGEEVLSAMRNWGMDTAGIQLDKEHPTGEVKISFEDSGHHSFEIIPNQAYDYIDINKALEVMQGQDFSMLYHGSLITRGNVSNNTLDSLIDKNIAPVFADINLRAPWWKADIINSVISKSKWLKLNDEELALIEPSKNKKIEEQAVELLKKYHQLEMLVVTQGADGAFALDSASITKCDKVVVENIVDTVGAGDAFCAVFIAGLLKGSSLKNILQAAVEFAAKICVERGATVNNKELYKIDMR